MSHPVSERLQGGCACGHIRYRLERNPIVVHCCHCHTCQRMSGSAFSINAMIETDQVTLIGDGVPTTSTDNPMMHRCPKCLLPLWGNHPMFGKDMAFVRVGNLDKADQLAPEVHYFTASKHPWVAIPPHVPAFEQGNEGDSVLGKEAQSRLNIVLEHKQ
ncbi:GFA family protein [Phyllobacterium sp. TAF24]|uniref:GFA family protein n=1 Tax=Phyllobacterium sp. TAF24 TaxID=3233068 RepID=UPI003F98E28C